MELTLGTVDRKIWSVDLLLEYLYQCYLNNSSAVINFLPEGSCAHSLELYAILDRFCAATGYEKRQITVKTANIVEHHDEYNIHRSIGGWYEIGVIREWLNGKTISSGVNPSKHFANFTSRNNWYRLWVATILDKYHGDKTIQTYHYNLKKENYNPNKYSGIDDLLKKDCEIVGDALSFLQSCPRTIDLYYLENLENCKDSIFQHENSYYPIQHPSNLNLLQYYKDFFVDVVCEPNASGRCFLCTEKIWRPIIAKRPFIVMSNFSYLSNLRKLGFKTFNQWWPENYDGVMEVDRIRGIEEVLNIISQWPLTDLSDKLCEMQQTLDHNYNVFMSLNPDVFRKAFDVCD
jgi:hypothetical protein